MTAFAFYLLKVMICSGVLFLYYYLALRNKLFHQWNRFYLLTAIVISLAAPVVQVTIMHRADEPDKAIQMLQVFESADGYLETVTITGRPSISTDQWLMMGYIVVSGVFLITMLLSFQKIISILRSHSVQWIEKIKFINTRAQGTPFSFFNFIFWNEDIDLQTETGQQIFQHELVHVKENHTVDKLFVQLVLIVFWCNPFFWLIRRELKIIHEFIADKKAVGEHGTAALAAMILSSSYPTHFNSLTNQFFQTSIKRRIAMLAKIQNPKISYLSRLLALPILTITVLAFTLRAKSINGPKVNLEKEITVVIDAAHGILPNGSHSGARVSNVSEDEIVLAVAKKINELNSNEKLKIVFTRSSDKMVDLKERVEIAQQNNADLFISLHVNASPDESASLQGIEVFVPRSPHAYQQQNEILASSIQNALKSVYSTNSALKTRQVGIWVLDKSPCPSVLVELGYLTNAKDRAFISDKNNQAIVAQKILAAIESYALNQQKSQVGRLDTVPQKPVILKEVVLEDPNALKLDNKNLNFPKLDSTNKPLLLLDGKEITRKELEKFNADLIESVTVLKDRTATDLYGEKAKNGAVIINSKRNIEVKEIILQPVDTIPKKNNQNKVKEIFIDGQKLRPDEVRFSKISPEHWEQVKNSKQPIIVDDKLVESIDNINLSEIVSMSKGIGHPLVNEYGEKAVLGVIFITTKNYKRTGGLDPIFQKVEIEASIDPKQWVKHLQSQLQSVIENAASNGMDAGTYTVQVRFLVLKDGTVTDVKALNDPGYGLAEAAVKTVQDGPKWRPGEQNGKPVNSYHTQPITFMIQDDDDAKKKTPSSEVTLNDLKKLKNLNLKIENLVSFDLVYLGDNGRVMRHRNSTSELDQTSKDILASQKAGAIVTVENITAKENGKQVLKPAIAFRVVQ